MLILPHVLHLLLLLPIVRSVSSQQFPISLTPQSHTDVFLSEIESHIEPTSLRPKELKKSTEATSTHENLSNDQLNSGFKGEKGELRSESTTSISKSLGETASDSKLEKAATTISKATKSSVSDECKFVSFEEWKKLKEAEHKNEQTSLSSSETQKASCSEKDIKEISTQTSPNSPAPVEDHGRTYKDKFNYASVNCAATVVKTNSDAKGASAILTEVKDSYLINKCSSANKFIVIELCQDILINTVVMGNYELFSSMFKDVKFLVSERFPALDGWRELGQFKAQNIRDVQSFDIKNPLIWARYLKIEILSHFGNEFYCPISIVRVHGTTMMEEVKNKEQTNELPDISESEQQALLNYTDDLELEECKARLPHLVLNDFLTELHSTKEYCDYKDANNATVASESSIITTQESIFQNIIKRLSLLESNSTLSLLYFEEQSKLLSEAFSNLEKRLNKRFENFAHRVNTTLGIQSLLMEQRIRREVQNLLEYFKRTSSETGSVTDKKLIALARELSFQRKIILIDTIFIISLLVYVTLTRDTRISDKQEKLNKAAIDPTPFTVGSKRHKTKGRKRR